VHRLPQGRPVQGQAADDLRVVPQEGRRQGAQGQLWRQVRELPRRGRLEEDQIQPRQATKYPLLGKHKQAKCTACHKGDLFKEKLQQACISCHQKDDDKSHKGQEGKKCETCHVEESWKKADKFNHNRMSTFPLLGRHGIVACKKCHLAPTFKDAKSDCWSCHEKDDAKVHKRRFGTECQVCHSSRAWGAWDFDHNKTNFKLDGPHKKTANKCYACHSKPMPGKVLTSTVCGSCHARDDVHNSSFGDRCERCHEGNDWKTVRMGAAAR